MPLSYAATYYAAGVLSSTLDRHGCTNHAVSACEIHVSRCVRPEAQSSNALKPTVNPRKLEHGFRRISAGIPFTLL